jgi:hypothetical protein
MIVNSIPTNIFIIIIIKNIIITKFKTIQYVISVLFIIIIVITYIIDIIFKCKLIQLKFYCY